MAVVGIDDSSVGQHERGSGISDSLATSNGHGSTSTDLELVGGELPETVGSVDSGPGQGSVELGRVDVAELVGADGSLTKIGGEDGLCERGQGVVEEGLLLGGLDSVELREGEADESVGVLVLHEGSRDSGGKLDGLAGDSCASNVHCVSSHVTSSSGSVTVRDGPGCSGHQLEAGGLLRVEVRVAGLGSSAELCVEQPEIGGSRVEVHVHGLATDLNGRKVFDVALLGGSRDKASS